MTTQGNTFSALCARQGWEHLGTATLLEGREYAQVGLTEAREGRDGGAIAHHAAALAVIDAELGRRERFRWATSGPKAPRRFDAGFARDLKARVDLRLLIGQTRPLKPSGDHALGLCPFHAEKSPSFAVYATHFFCFGCKRRGDAYDWALCEWRGETAGGATGLLDFPDAVRMVASWRGIAPPPLPGERLGLDEP